MLLSVVAGSLRSLFSLFCLLSFATATAQPGPALAPNHLSLPDKNYSLRFYWQGDSVAGQWEPHAALLLPVTLPGCPKTFFLQFDLGAPSTVFYRNLLRQIHARYPETQAVDDSATTLTNYRFRVGNMPVGADEVALVNHTSAAIDWNRKNAVEIIGTIGADFIENRVVVIDYPSRMFYHRKEPPAKRRLPAQWSDFMFVRRTVLLPAVVDGKRTVLFFDTGSSAYALLTDKATAEKLAIPGTVAEKYAARSWDRTWTATTVKTRDSIVIAHQTLPLHTATYMEGVSRSQIEQMMKMGIGGMTGNKLFVNSVLVLDTKAKKFALLVDGK